MSGPYRFTQESAKSPLERQLQSPVSDGQPVSFKTNVNRMKTKKWVEAKKNAYDGDDWGDYDEYDEYGTESAPPPPSATPSGPRGYGQRFDQSGRSFTDPRQPGGPQPARRNSFERGDEHRAFSASMAQPPQQYGYGQPPQQRPPPEQLRLTTRQASGAESDVSDTPQHRKDFSPTALPHPLHTRISPAPNTSSPQSVQFPPRKSSISQVESPTATSPRGRAPSNPGKPLPFVRPADIYKRFEEEKQRASMESSRPSLDSLDTASPPRQAHPQEPPKPLETVAERKSEYSPDLSTGQQVQDKPSSNPESSQSFLPPVPLEGISDFGNELWSSGQQSDQDLRNAVDQAFTRTDDSRSVPPTPISKSDSDVSRSNTNSTSGISPIMSRVPSSATSALKARNQAAVDNSTPVIVEESSDAGTPVSRPTSSANAFGTTQQIPRKPSPSHSRNASNTSLPRQGLATPTSVGSPARSPAIEPQKRLPEPEVAQLSGLNSPTLNSPLSDASTREADLASALNKSSDSSGALFGAAEKDSQMAFLESHHAQSSIDDALPRSRSESPSKGRVQELAGKFGDVSHSRRGSTQSIASKTSLQSWEKSQDNSRPASPSKANATTKENWTGRPTAEREASFRPKLPGQWESYATTVSTPSEHNKELVSEKTEEEEEEEEEEEGPASSSLETADITPTTSKFPTVSAEPAASNSSVMLSGLSHGDVIPRPLYVDRTSSSVSLIPPTPPAKETPQYEDLPPPAPLKPKEQLSESSRTSAEPTDMERPSMVPQLSTDTSAEDEESDRLRKEIVAQLTPKTSFAAPAVDMAQSSPPTRLLEGSSEAAKPAADAADAPSLLTRFSWEGDSFQSQDPTQTEPTRNVVEEAKLPAPAVEEATQKHPHESYENLPEPSFGPSHSAAPHPEAAITDDKGEPRAATPPLEPSKPLDSPVSPPSGLHVVNSADHPEAVDLPHRLSAQALQASDVAAPSEDKSAAVEDAKTPESPKVVTQTPPPTAGAGTVPPPVPKSPVSDKPLGFRDIINIKSSSERITIYNKTREYWAHADHGLNDWVSSAVNANPDLATDPYSQPRPVPAASTSSRHKTTASISIPLFGKHHASPQAGSGGASSQTPTTPTASSTQSGLGRTASHQMQSKGKDLMHTAGVLSGKGLTGAKGLFAKGKSRFKMDKDPPSRPEASALALVSSSREPSSEPEFTPNHARAATPNLDTRTSPSSKAHRTMDTPESIHPKEHKLRRRFSLSSHFPHFHRHRSAGSGTVSHSRSRSRPCSIISPLYTQFDCWGAGGGGTKGTAAVETPPAGLDYNMKNGGEKPFSYSEQYLGSRPYSYVAPEAWGVVPEGEEPDSAGLAAQVVPEVAGRLGEVGEISSHGGRLTPPEYLGVLPSPAKSSFSFFGKEGDDDDEDVPPVPEIPKDAEDMYLERGRLQRKDFVTESLLRSVVRYSTPPGMEAVGVRNTLLDKGTLTRQDSVEREMAWLEGGGNGIEGKTEGERGVDLWTAVEREGETIGDGDSNELHSPVLVASTQCEDDQDDLPPQLNHDPNSLSFSTQRATNDNFPMHNMPDVGQVSPILSAVGANGLEDGNASLEPDPFRMQKPRFSMGDVSPMFPPAQLSLYSPSGTRDGRSEYDVETELIGSDISPISQHNISETNLPADDVATLRAPLPTEMGGIAVGVVESSQTLQPGQVGLVPDGSQIAPRSAERPRFVATASQLQVVHAVQYAPSQSQSSLETWDQDSIAAPSHSDGSPVLEEAPESEIPLIPQPNSVSLRGEHEVERAGVPRGPVSMAIMKTSTRPNATESATTEPGAQGSHDFDSRVHKRSESLLSKISSMVPADSTSVSPLPSPGLPQSRSASAIPQRQIPPAKASPIPAQIVEERPLSSVASDDFDLYADEHGNVKDESGRTLRGPPVGSRQKAQFNASKMPRQQHTPQGSREEPSRYSEERPMSFVSGPRDSNGRPQDHINRPSTSERAKPPLPRTRQAKESGAESNGTAYSQSPLAQQAAPAMGLLGQQFLETGNVGSVSSLNSNRSHLATSPHSTVSPIPSATASPPAPSSPQPGHVQRQLDPSPKMKNGHVSDMHDSRFMEDPRLVMEAQMRGARKNQPSQETRVQRPLSAQGSSIQEQPLGQDLSKSQYDAQQPMARQAIDPRLRGIPQQTLGHPSMPSKKEEKSSSRPKLSAVLKGLGKSHSSTPSPPAQQALQPPPPNHMSNSPGRVPVSGGDRRSASHQFLSQDHLDQVTPRNERRVSGFVPPSNRPTSMGAVSHLSQDSTRVQASDSPLDMGPPDIHASLNRIALPQAPYSASGLPKVQPYGNAPLPVAETGKKKRFSALGNLFSRGKEEKKAQKAQRQSTAAGLQPGQAWPPQQYFHPQQPGLQYGASPAERHFPGIPPVQQPVLSSISHQGLYPEIVQQFAQPPALQGYPRQAFPDHTQLVQAQTQQLSSQPVYPPRPAHVYVEQPPQRYQQAPPQMPHQAQQPPLHQEGSAYMDTRRMHLMNQQRLAQQGYVEPFSQFVRAEPPNSQHHQGAQQSPGPGSSSPGGQHKPDTNQLDHGQAAATIPPQQYYPPPPSHQQQPQQFQQPHHAQSIADQPGIHDPNAVSHMSQHHKNNEEPRYETPEIPAAYTHVRPYVSPSSADRPFDTQQNRQPSSAHYNQQKPEPQMQPISPQVSATTQAPANPRSNSEGSSISMISPISDPSPGLANLTLAANPRNNTTKMSSITEQAHTERAWHLNLPEGLTEQEIVRARARQHMEQHFLAQEQLYAERTGRSPSPRSTTTHSQSPRPSPHGSPHLSPPLQSGGYREVIPRSSPKPYPSPKQAFDPSLEKEMGGHSSYPARRTPVHPNQVSNPALVPLPVSPDPASVRSARNPIADSLAPPPTPPTLPPSPAYSRFPDQRVSSSHSHRSGHQDSPKYEEIPLVQHQNPHEPEYHQSDYDDHPPTDEPPPYSGPGSPHEGMLKEDRQESHPHPHPQRQPEPQRSSERPSRHRPPNIITNSASTRSHNDPRASEPRTRQTSIGMLQHPQPASMAASPAHSSADMGADSLRRQLLEQEERERVERLQRAQALRVESQREREERERARARARELERSVSGGGRVGSLRDERFGSVRSVGSSASGSGRERRSGSTSRPVFELPAMEDEEPVMRATSFPGQEWVPTWTED